MQLLHTLKFVALVSLMGCSAEHESTSQPTAAHTELRLQHVSIHLTNEPEKNNTYEILVHFNRALTKQELSPAIGFTHTYGLKFWLFSKNGWEHESYGIKLVQSGLTREANTAYWLTSESSHHPLRGYNAETDEAFTPENITGVIVELYTRNKNYKVSKYQLLDKKEFHGWH